MKQSVGIAGGRPSSSHYFIAAQNSQFFYLDPHVPHSYLSWKPADEITDEELSTFHTRRLRRINVKDLDPSMMICFLIRTLDDWKEFTEEVTEVNKRCKGILNIAISAHGQKASEKAVGETTNIDGDIAGVVALSDDDDDDDDDDGYDQLL